MSGSAAEHEPSFTHDLDAIAQHATETRVSVGEIEEILQGRGFATLSLILCIPFIQPIPLPGLSFVFGMAIVALGLRLTFGQAGGLPEFVKRRQVDSETLLRLTAGAKKVFSYVERFFRPRLNFMQRPPMLNLVGASIVASGFALSLPLPPVILFSNALPAWAIIALCLGYLERDGLAIIAGHILMLATWCYFAFWWEAVKLGVSSLLTYLFP